jgi:hypothetical protein
MYIGRSPHFLWGYTLVDLGRGGTVITENFEQISGMLEPNKIIKLDKIILLW